MTKQTEINLMLDLETVGTSNNSGILSIGIVPFYHPFPELPIFYDRVSVRSLEENKFVFDPNTMKWWDKQDPTTRAEAFGGTKPIHEVLYNIHSYFNELPPNTKKLLWGKGSDFDNTLLADAYDICGIEPPWNFRNNRCFRTLEALFPIDEALIPPEQRNQQKHNALEDARYQAIIASMILFNLKGVPV